MNGGYALQFSLLPIHSKVCLHGDILELGAAMNGGKSQIHCSFLAMHATKATALSYLDRTILYLLFRVS